MFFGNRLIFVVVDHLILIVRSTGENKIPLITLLNAVTCKWEAGRVLMEDSHSRMMENLRVEDLKPERVLSI